MERFAVIGLGRFGRRLSTMLAAQGAEVIAIDRDRSIVEELRDQVTLAIAMDATDETALRVQGVDQVDCAIVGIGHNFESNALTTVLLKSMRVERVISRAAPHSGQGGAGLVVELSGVENNQVIGIGYVGGERETQCAAVEIGGVG